MSASPSTTTMANMPGMAHMPGMAQTAGSTKASSTVTTLGSGSGTAAHHVTGMGGMRMGVEPPINLHTVVSDWMGGLFAPAVAVVLVALALWYVLATRRLRAEKGRHWSRWRTTSFLSSLVVVEIALGGSVAVLANYTFSAHVVQHLLLMVIAPPLAALGAPSTLALQTSKHSTKQFLLRVLHSRAFGVISHPVPTFFLYYLSMYAFFLTGALNYAMLHMWVMDLVNLGFAFGATLFWWPMVGIDPIPRWSMTPGLKLLNLIVGVPIESFLGIIILMMSAPAASMYTLATTHFGGGLLWVGTEVATVAAIVPMFVQWSGADARDAKRIDARIAAGNGMAPPVFEGNGMAATFKALRRG